MRKNARRQNWRKARKKVFLFSFNSNKKKKNISKFSSKFSPSLAHSLSLLLLSATNTPSSFFASDRDTDPSSSSAALASEITNLFQKGWPAQRRYISSIGTPRVSGTKKKTNSVIATTHPPKKRKIPHLNEQSREMKTWPIRAVSRKLTETLIDWPTERVSRGWTSAGMSHPMGPHETAKAET